MEKEEFRKYIEKECKENNIINLQEFEIDKLYTYMKEILKWNEKVNLTAIKEEKEFIVKHFIDSLTIAEYIKNGENVIDIGTGAGFPGIPLKIIRNKSKIVLVDAVNKKLNVIRDILPKIKIEDAKCIHSRAEDLAQSKEYREAFDCVVSRAVSNLTTLVEYMLPFAKIGGKVICMKGPNFEEELKESLKAINILGGKIEKKVTLKIDNVLERNLIIINKENPTPKQYPRGQGKPLKNPIK